MMEYQIRLSSREYAANADTELTFSQAVDRARADDKYTYVVAVYPVDTITHHNGKDYPHPAGETIFGYRVSINGQRPGWNGPRRPAEVNWSALGASAPEDATLYAKMITIAAEIAATANTQL